MMKAILVPSNTDLNRGDQALVWESVRLIKDLEGMKDVCIIGSTDSENPQSAQTISLGYNLLEPILNHPSRLREKNSKKKVHYTRMQLISWGARALVDFFTVGGLLRGWPLNIFSTLFLNEKQKKTLRKFKEADVIFVKGGGFVHSYGKMTDWYVMYYSLFLIRLGLRHGKRVVFLPNSFGPLNFSPAKKMVLNVLSQCKLVLVREKVSLNFLSEMGINAKLFPDLGYFLEPSEKKFSDYLEARGIPFRTQRVVGITARPYRFPASENPQKKYEDYICSMVEFVIALAGDGYFPCFCAHTLGPSAHEDDRIAIKDIMNRLPDGISFGYICDETLNCRDMMKIYSYFHSLIGTRFHSVIFSQTTGIKTIAIAYGGNKATGIMSDAGLGDYTIPIEEISGKRLTETFKRLDRQSVLDRSRLLQKREELKRVLEATLKL